MTTNEVKIVLISSSFDEKDFSKEAARFEMKMNGLSVEMRHFFGCLCGEQREGSQSFKLQADAKRLKISWVYCFFVKKVSIIHCTFL